MSSLPVSARLRIEFARDFRGRQPAFEWLNELDDLQRKRMDGAIKYLVTIGREHSVRERLSSLHNVGGVPRRVARQLWMLRGGRFLRIIGCFRAGGVFLALHGVDKHRDEYEVGDIQAAGRVMNEHDAQAAGSLDFVRARTPKAPSTFKPTIVPPPTARPEPPTPPPVELFPAIEQEHVWAWVDKRDLLPPEAPLLKSLCRLPTYRHVILREHLQRFIEGRLQSMPINERIAFGLVDEVATHLTIGAFWALEYVTARTLNQLALEPEPEAVAQQQPAQAPEHAPEFYWLHGPAEQGHGRKRRLVEKLGAAPTRSRRDTNERVEKVLTRTYLKSSGRWSNVLVTPADVFTNRAATPAAIDDPLVIEALRARAPL